MRIIVVMRGHGYINVYGMGKHYQSTRHEIENEKSTTHRKENVKMSNKQEMSLRHTFIPEGWGNSPRLASRNGRKRSFYSI